MTVFVGPDTPHARVDGQDYWFCRPGCLEAFTGQAA
jgi:xanthine dehydrogenase accessory factor